MFYTVEHYPDPTAGEAMQRVKRKERSERMNAGKRFEADWRESIAKAENVSAYKAIGINYIRFAAEEREFFRLLFMSEHTEKDILKTHTEMPYVLKVLEEEENITGALAQDIYEEMWLFSHGVATMIATGTAKFTQERIEEMLTAVYRGLINNQTQKKERRQE